MAEHLTWQIENSTVAVTLARIADSWHAQAQLGLWAATVWGRDRERVLQALGERILARLTPADPADLWAA